MIDKVEDMNQCVFWHKEAVPKKALLQGGGSYFQSYEYYQQANGSL